jgi:hypothetical protein
MMTEWYSERFGRFVSLTKHAVDRMKERTISYDLIRELIETGETRYKDEHHVWIYKSFTERDDNLICAAVVLEQKIIIKTIMHRWQLMEVEHET